MTPTEAAFVFGMNHTKAPQENIFWRLLNAFTSGFVQEVVWLLTS